jgi:hypothetical protein
MKNFLREAVVTVGVSGFAFVLMWTQHLIAVAQM